MSKPLVAQKHTGLASHYNKWIPLHNRQIVFYGIESLGEVLTIAGPMYKVKLRQRVEFININQDVAALVGKLQLYNDDGTDWTDIPPPSLWYWNDKYWLQALDSSTEWYKKQCYLLYEAPVTVSDEYLSKLTDERERIAKGKS